MQVGLCHLMDVVRAIKAVKAHCGPIRAVMHVVVILTNVDCSSTTFCQCAFLRFAEALYYLTESSCIRYKYIDRVSYFFL